MGPTVMEAAVKHFSASRVWYQHSRRHSRHLKIFLNSSWSSFQMCSRLTCAVTRAKQVQYGSLDLGTLLESSSTWIASSKSRTRRIAYSGNSWLASGKRWHRKTSDSAKCLRACPNMQSLDAGLLDQRWRLSWQESTIPGWGIRHSVARYRACHPNVRLSAGDTSGMLYWPTRSVPSLVAVGPSARRAVSWKHTCTWSRWRWKCNL